MHITVIHQPDEQSFYALVDGKETDAEMAYSLPSPHVIDFTHTYVPEALRGKGVADELIKTGLNYARDNGYQIIASCPVVRHYVTQYHEYQSLQQKTR